jgi:hypothetical protein
MEKDSQPQRPLLYVISRKRELEIPLISKIFKKPEPELLTKIKEPHSTGGHIVTMREREGCWARE